MCLIIKKPAGRPVHPAFLAHVWAHNSHGWGSFHVLGGKLFSAKGMQFEDLIAHCEDLPADVEVYLHLRKATYGHITEDMAHPYVVRDGLLLMHNGTIHHMAPRDPRMSDTAELARALQNLLEGLSEAQAVALVRSEGFLRVTAPLVEGSMVVLHDRAGAVRLGRDWHTVQAPEWDDEMAGIDVSNTHAWRPRNRVTPPFWQRALATLRSRWARTAGASPKLSRPLGRSVLPTRY
jgi:hypothetical protein